MKASVRHYYAAALVFVIASQRVHRTEDELSCGLNEYFSCNVNRDPVRAGIRTLTEFTLINISRDHRDQLIIRIDGFHDFANAQRRFLEQFEGLPIERGEKANNLLREYLRVGYADAVEKDRDEADDREWLRKQPREWPVVVQRVVQPWRRPPGEIAGDIAAGVVRNWVIGGAGTLFIAVLALVGGWL